MLLFFLNLQIVHSQNLQLKIKVKSDFNNSVIEGMVFKKYHQNTNSIDVEIDSILLQFQKKGYLNGKLDSITENDSIFLAQFSLGKQIKEIKIYFQKEDLPFEFLAKKAIQQIIPNTNEACFLIPFEEINSMLDLILTSFEQKGNVFTQVQLKNIQLEDDTAIAELFISQTQERSIDKIVIKGYENFPKTFIHFDLNLKIKSTFNTAKLKNASDAILNLSFAEELKSPEVLFTKDSTIIYLYLKKKLANKFDGIIGFSSKEDSNGLEFNGYLDLLLQNIFNSGESIALLWKNNGGSSQRFFFSVETPYLFNLPIIPKATFEIFRQDSTYNNIAANFNLNYVINSKNKSNIAFSTETSNDLLKSNNLNASLQTFTNVFYGFGHEYKVVQNNILFPEKFNVHISALFGRRKTDIETAQQSKFNLQISYLMSLNIKNYIFLQNKSAIINSTNFLTNEIYRIGGVTSIRGFNEESIFTPSYSILNIEYRYKTSNSSYFYTITDFAYFEDQNKIEPNQIYGLGLGYSFLTKMGMLNLSYAVGKFGDKPFNLNDSKVHIKLVSFF